MTTFCNSPESVVPSSRRDTSGAALVPAPVSSATPGGLGGVGSSSNSSRSVSPATRYGSPRQDQDIPYFTVARYQNPTAPITYELPAIPQYGLGPDYSESLPSIADTEITSQSGAGEAFYNGSLDLSPISPMELAFGKVVDVNGGNGEWLGKAYDIPHTPTPGSTSRDITTPREDTDRSGGGTTPTTPTPSGKSSQDRSPLGCLHAASGSLPRLPEDSSQSIKTPVVTPKPKIHDDIPVRGCVNFTIDASRKPPPIKPKPYPKPNEKTALKRRISVPASVTEGTGKPPQKHRNSIGEEVIREDVVENSSVNVSKTGAFEGQSHSSSDMQSRNVAKRSCCENRKSEVYEDARVTDAAEKLENSRPSSSNEHTPRTPRTPRSKSREPSFCLELEEDNYPKTDAEYVALLQRKIAEAHERQLLPLKEDLADWLNKLLGEDDLTPDNLITKLDNGVIMCRLATIISTKAQDARDKELSTLEVPRLPYRIWARARSGTFFARDNISNFIRFCKRLGVHSNLLFETEDLVCGTGVRGVVLCILEVGRLAQLWWGIEPPGLVKLERELDGEELSGRSDSGFSNTSSPRESTLALHSAVATPAGKPPRPMSAPSQLPATPKLSVATSSQSPNHVEVSSTPPGTTRLKSSTSRGPKPTPPPKPANIKRAVENITKRPNSFPTSRSYDRGWSGAKTTPTTPVTTPTHTPRTRLPVAKTPRSSGRSTPNTTPTTPTQCRRYLVSMQRSPTGCSSPKPVGSNNTGRTPTRIPIRTPTLCARLQDALVSPNPDDEAKVIQSDLDNKVQDIVEQTQGMCGCRDVKCVKPHIKRLSDGKYDVLGKNVLIRLLKGKHVMVRVGGGWDTLEHYLLRHDPTQVKMFKAKSNSDSPFLHIRSKYRSPTPSEKSSRGSSSRDNSFSDSLRRNGDGSPSRQSSPTASERSFMDDNHQMLECLEETSPNDPQVDLLCGVKDGPQVPHHDASTPNKGKAIVSPQKKEAPNSHPSDQNMGMDEIEFAFRSLEEKMKNSDHGQKKKSSSSSGVDPCTVFNSYHKSSSCGHHNGSCQLLSAPVGEDGDFQHLPSAISTTSLNSMLVVSCPTLDLAESVSDLTNLRCPQDESDADASANEDSSTQAGSDDENIPRPDAYF